MSDQLSKDSKVVHRFPNWLGHDSGSREVAASVVESKTKVAIVYNRRVTVSKLNWNMTCIYTRDNCAAYSPVRLPQNLHMMDPVSTIQIPKGQKNSSFSGISSTICHQSPVFLEFIVTVDEMWVYHHVLETKCSAWNGSICGLKKNK